MQPRADAAVDRECQRLPQIARFVQVQLEMPAGVDVDVQGVSVHHHEALDRSVAHTGLRIARDDHAGVEVGPAVVERMRWYRNPGQIDLRLRHFEDRTVSDHFRGHRLPLPALDAIGNELRERGRIAAHQSAQ